MKKLNQKGVFGIEIVIAVAITVALILGFLYVHQKTRKFPVTIQEVGVRFMLPVSLKGFAYTSTAILNPDDHNTDIKPNQITLNDGTAGIETTLVYMTAPAAEKTYKQCLKKEVIPASKYYFSDLIVKQGNYSPDKLPHNLYPEQHHLLKQFKGYFVVIEPRQLTKEDCDPNAPVDKLNKQLQNLSDNFEKSFIATATPYK